MLRGIVIGVCLCAGAVCAAGQDAGDFEAYRVEVTGSAWLLDTRGTIQAGSLPVNLRSDLGVEERQPTFTGRIDFKPGRRHHILVEGTPYRLTGLNTLSRTVTYQGQQYSFSDTVRSSAEVNYVFGGYQYDLLSRRQGHLGLFIGGAYVDATASLRSVGTNVTAQDSERIGLPLPGVNFRAYLLPGRRLLDINGSFQGMSLGDYGRFVEGTLRAGISPVRFVALEAGYMVVDADVHSRSGTHGVAPHFSGPVFSVRFRDR